MKDVFVDRMSGERLSAERLPSDPDVLTAGQLAERLGFATNTVTALARSGALPGRRFGKEWRFWWPAVVAAMSQPDPEVAGQAGETVIPSPTARELDDTGTPGTAEQ